MRVRPAECGYYDPRVHTSAILYAPCARAVISVQNWTTTVEFEDVNFDMSKVYTFTFSNSENCSMAHCIRGKCDMMTSWHGNVFRIIDLRTLRGGCAGLLWSNFFGQPGSVSIFPPFLWVKLWVGWVGRDIQKLADIFPHRGLIGLLSSQRKNFCFHWDFRSLLNHQKCLYGMLFLRLKAWFYVQYTIPPQAAMSGLLSLADYLC